MGAIGVAALLIPSSAFAATISDPLLSNGDTTIDAMGNATVTGTFTLQVGSGETCEVLRTQAAPQAFTDSSVGGTLGKEFGTYTNMPFSVKVSPNTGTYYPTAQCAGIFGGNRAVDGADNVIVTANLGTIRVVAGGVLGSGNPAPVQVDQWAQIQLTLNGILAALTKLSTTPPAPAKPAYCAGVLSWTSTVELQNTLVSAGFMSQTDMNTGPGTYGPKTDKAHKSAKAVCQS